MSMIKKSITVTKKQEQWIQDQMATGHYGTDSELIREALREKAQRMAEIESIRAKLIAAEKKGFTDLLPEQILQLSKKKLLDNGKL